MFKKKSPVLNEDGTVIQEVFTPVERISGVFIWRLLALVAFGMTIFSTAAMRFNVYYIAFGTLVCLVLGWFYKHFLRFVLGLVNPAVKKNIGKKMIHYAVDNSMLFLVPFAVMSLIATYYLKWTLTTTFLSTAIMSVGTAAAIEVGKIRENPSLRNTIMASGVAFMFSLVVNLGVQLLSKVPPYIEALLRILPDLVKGGSLW